MKGKQKGFLLILSVIVVCGTNDTGEIDPVLNSPFAKVLREEADFMLMINKETGQRWLGHEQEGEALALFRRRAKNAEIHTMRFTVTEHTLSMFKDVDSKVIHLQAAARSGKSELLCQKAKRDILLRGGRDKLTGSAHEFWIMAPSKNKFGQPLIDILKQKPFFPMSMVEYIAPTFVTNPNWQIRLIDGTRVGFRLPTVEGIGACSVRGIYLTECGRVNDQLAFTEMQMRGLSCDGKIFLEGSPFSQRGWLKTSVQDVANSQKELAEKDPSQPVTFRCEQIGIEQNPFLNPAAIASLRSEMKDPVMRKRLLDGIAADLDLKFYNNWTASKAAALTVADTLGLDLGPDITQEVNAAIFKQRYSAMAGVDCNMRGSTAVVLKIYGDMADSETWRFLVSNVLIDHNGSRAHAKQLSDIYRPETDLTLTLDQNAVNKHKDIKDRYRDDSLRKEVELYEREGFKCRGVVKNYGERGMVAWHNGSRSWRHNLIFDLISQNRIYFIEGSTDPLTEAFTDLPLDHANAMVKKNHQHEMAGPNDALSYVLGSIYINEKRLARKGGTN